MTTTGTAATDSKTIMNMKGTTEQNKTDSLDERMKIIKFCIVLLCPS